MTSKARNLLGFFKNQKFKQNEFGTLKTLFHPLNESPIPSLRALGERISNKGKCPIEGVGPLKYYCPISGYPTHSSKEAYEKDSHHRNTYATRLREVNEDEHDLRSGREMKEFEMPGLQDIEQTVNLKSWEMLFYTRNFNSVDNLRSQRHLSRLLSYPMTIAGILHELGPYADRAGGRVTPHGERSLLGALYVVSFILLTRKQLCGTCFTSNLFHILLQHPQLGFSFQAQEQNLNFHHQFGCNSLIYSHTHAFRSTL